MAEHEPLPATTKQLEQRIQELEAKLAATAKDEPEKRAALEARLAQLETKLEKEKKGDEPKPEEPSSPGWFPKLF